MRRVTISVLMAGALIKPVEAKDIVPLRRGYYVNRDVPCDRASNATLTLFTGKSFGATCVVDSMDKVGDTYRIAQTCNLREGAVTHSADYTIINSTEYVETSEFGVFYYRDCEQESLPSPWSKTNLGHILEPSGGRPMPSSRAKTP